MLCIFKMKIVCVQYIVIPLVPATIMFLFCVCFGRASFDLTEGESELVSGYNVECSSMSFHLSLTLTVSTASPVNSLVPYFENERAFSLNCIAEGN